LIDNHAKQYREYIFIIRHDVEQRSELFPRKAILVIDIPATIIAINQHQ